MGLVVALRWGATVLSGRLVSARMRAVGRHRVGTSSACRWTAEWLDLTVAVVYATMVSRTLR